MTTETEVKKGHEVITSDIYKAAFLRAKGHYYSVVPPAGDKWVKFRFIGVSEEEEQAYSGDEGKEVSHLLGIYRHIARELHLWVYG